MADTLTNDENLARPAAQSSMQNSMKVSLFSPEKPLAEVLATHLQIPAMLGEMGIKPGHTAMIAELGVGQLTIEGDNLDAEYSYFISGGYMEVANNSVTVLIDVAESPDDINLERASEAEARAEERLRSSEGTKTDISRALASLARAKARKKLASAGRQAK